MPATTATLIVRTFATVAVGAAGMVPLTVAASVHASPLPGATQVTYYENCTEARKAGVTPIQKGEDGYASHLDRDGDGIACE